MPEQIVIIGAGYSGLAAACLLSKQGWKVKVIEKNGMSGGRAQVWRDKGFVFDMGPSWYMMPPAFDHLFSRLGEKSEDYFDLIRLDPSYRIFHEGGWLDIRPELEDNRETFDRLEPDGYRKTVKYLNRAEKQYTISVDNFLYRGYRSLLDIISPGFLIKGLRLGLLSSVEQLARRAFDSEILQKLMKFTMVFIGGSPKKTPGLYSLMSYIDLKQNVWYPPGGMNEPAAALEKIARAQGAEFIFNAPVDRVLVENSSAVGVKISTGEIPGDIVISNADYFHTEMSLLGKDFRSFDSDYWSKRTVSPSAFIIYLGLNKKIDRLLHHNLYFHKYWDEHFQTIFDRPGWPPRFSYYVCCPSNTDPSVAPEGHENLFFLIPVAAGLEDDSDERRQSFFNQVMDHFEEMVGEEVRSAIISRRIFSQRDFKETYNSWQGSAFGLSHTLLQTAMFRPAHSSSKVKNLYFTGQYTHPGVGLPMTLISAEVLADRIQSDHGRSRR